MRRAPFKLLLLIIVGAAVWGALLFASSSDNVKVVSLERNMSKNQTDLHNRDCFITGLNQKNKRVSGYAPSSFCSSVKAGDTVIIKDGIVTRK